MRYFWPIVTLIAAAGLQGNLPDFISIWGAKPDLIIVVLISYALAADPEFGAVLGFVAGLLQGRYVGLSMGSFIITRTITGFLSGLVTTRLFSENPLVPALSAVWLTVVCEVLFLLGNPQSDLIVVARKIAGECLGNAILTLLVYFTLRNLDIRRKIKLANARL
ncbi:MAG: rod shape-determining protein MreD [Armatimonadetes bacterium]|nr:rod shape-determining protein MreD [Armatimonadota bacterium]